MHVSSKPAFWDEKNEKFFAKYNKLDATHKEWSKLVVDGKPIVGPLGREWFIEMSVKRGELAIPWTTLSNYPVQGTGADLMMLVRLSARKRIDAAGIPCKWRSTVHDSIVIDVEEKYLDMLRVIFDQVFADLPKNIEALFGYSWKTPMACESKYGPTMLDMRKFK